jgi:large subunit ribosomal protein L18e
MGIDLKAGGRRIGHNSRKAPVSKNVYVKLLEKLFAFIARRGDSKFAETICKRLRMSQLNKAPISVSRLARYMKGDDKIGKTAVIVGTVTGDKRTLELPALKVAALRFTEEARKAITAAGGQCMTLDQLALLSPKGSHTVLLRGPKNARESVAHFGHSTSVYNLHTHDAVKPYVKSKGRKFEKARGRRRTNGFKV